MRTSAATRHDCHPDHDKLRVRVRSRNWLNPCGLLWVWRSTFPPAPGRTFMLRHAKLSHLRHRLCLFESAVGSASVGFAGISLVDLRERRRASTDGMEPADAPELFYNAQVPKPKWSRRCASDVVAA